MAAKVQRKYDNLKTSVADLYPLLFEPTEKTPALNGILSEIKARCATTNLSQDTVAKCAKFSDSLAATTVDDKEANQIVLIRKSIGDLNVWIDSYESSPSYSVGKDLEGYENIGKIIFPVLPIFPITQSISMAALPHPVLVLIVTISMGALGSVLFMLQLHLAARNLRYPLI